MSNDISVVLDLDRGRRAAMTKADVDTLSEMFADDMVWIHASARVDTKTGLLEAIANGSTKYLRIEVKDETIRSIGDVVLIGGVATMKAEIKGAVREVNNRFTVIWAVQPDGAWRVVNWQSTSVREA
ncbi:nuclear transport factor 2 family protein [Mycobacterium sp.]|uniref:nuclear transport factor 2 family protein n=1 Tax=Mycobacterium sp. TaxID=1785 RepID=UPI002C8764C3|nr:nuclear transport factor 2 family protein [Mycobacterium sp.]HKP42204.1 nuclear transport factor 2 family protein [Mycobacterium sp.]